MDLNAHQLESNFYSSTFAIDLSIHPSIGVNLLVIHLIPP